MALASVAQPQALVGDVPPAAIGALEGRFQDIVALLSQAMRSVVIDLPGEAGVGAASAISRRVLCIELTARDEAWIDGVFAQPQRVMSATL